MKKIPFPLPVCDQPATGRIEIYTPDPAGDAFGSLDASVYACDAHEPDVIAAAWAADMTAYRIEMAPGVDRTCSEVYVYRTGNLGGGQ
ncbi:hypothetical protein O7634_24670 [Micromonospora sp. WMMD1120]|uniref:hypothetical protein n=1 Tax=Micromonospora sp. WMMD1120 TaxID=3016106 RepID=UPI0024161B67|nr:hypothetical protein [Micromonospora sp. WMMD1120]MDG4809958.1 hypothetical protein [Micromonospora sp. WMMD1120]